MSPSRMACLPARKPFRTIVRALIAFVFFPALAGAQQVPVPARITQPVDPTSLTVLKGNVHPLARPEFDRGPAPAALQLDRMLLVLKRSPEQEAALESLLDQQQDKSSPNYHQWLTPQQFGQQFGPADQDVQTIVAWLESQGFQVDRVANGRAVIEFSGDAGQVQNAFRTEIHKYAVNGKNYWANASDPQIPSALAPVVAGVASLNSFRRRPMYQLLGIFAKSKKTGQVKRVASATVGATAPNFTFNCGTDPSTGQPITCYAVSPYDFATIYNVLPLWNASSPITGSGQSIAIVARTNINVQDVADFQSLFGLPANPPTVILDGPDPGLVSGDETEADIDVEWSGAVAKGAKINLVVSQSTEASDGVDLSALYIVDNDVAPVMSESYGECELGLGAAGNQFTNNLWEQAAAEGITVFVSSGDSGSAGCDGYQGNTPEAAQYGVEVNGLASTPYNVAVGGTDFNDFFNGATYWNTTNNSITQASVKGYVPETTWNDSCTNAIFAQLGFTGGAEANCNNPQLSQFVLTIGGGGGKSGCTTPNGTAPSNCSGGYAKPSWQAGAGVPNDSKRDVPDVSLFASNGFVGNFYMMCERDAQNGQPCSTSNFLGVGGTSVASPSFAGIMALVEQKTGAAEGNANYILYKLAAKSGSTCTSAANPATTCVFYDTPAGSTIAMPCVKGTPNCTVSNSVDQYGVLSGYATTAGYDLATGLGSVNASNLANGWSAVGSTPSTTALTLNNGTAVNIAHGSPVPVSVSVTPASPMPTGNVALLAKQNGSSTDFGTLTLGTNGSASGTFTMLPGGTSYSVVAHYAGDATYAGSDSNAVTVTVNPEASKTLVNFVTFDNNGNLISFDSSGITYGAGYGLLRVDVGDSGASVSATTGISSKCSKGTASCPTGTVTLSSTPTPLNVGSLLLNVDGYAEDQSISAGTYAITANYPGDASYNASTGSANFTISKAPTTVDAAVEGLPVQYGDFEEISATILTTSSGAAPTGTVSFSLDGSPLSFTAPVYEGFPYEPSNSPPQYATLSATSSTEFVTTIGNHTLTATYSGDSNYAGGTSPGATITITQALPFFSTFGASPATTNVNQPVTLTAQMFGSDAGVPPTGTNTFYDDKTLLAGAVTYSSKNSNGGVSSSLDATMPYTPTTPGIHNITVKYSGDSNYLPASSPGPATLTVIGPDFTLASQPGATTVTAGSSATYTVNITGTDGFTGNVSVTCSLTAADTTCAANPASVATGAATTITVTTTAHQFVPPAPGSPDFGPRLKITPFLFLLTVTLLLLKFFGKSRRRRFAYSISFAAALLVIFLLGGCGGGSSSPPPPPPTPHGTQPGLYTVTIVGTSGNLTHTTTVSLTVQ